MSILYVFMLSADGTADLILQYENTQNFGITADDAVNYLLNLSKFARSIGLGIDLKNGGNLLVDGSGGATSYQQSLVDAFDFNIIEECVSKRCRNLSESFACSKLMDPSSFSIASTSATITIHSLPLASLRFRSNTRIRSLLVQL